MTVSRLDHINLRTGQLPAMITWYEEALGLVNGPRPNFGFPGAWMYVGDDAIVHLVAVDEDPGAGAEQPLKMEHFALTGLGTPEDFEARMTNLDARFSRVEIADFGIIQYNIWDPDGNHIHVDFRNEV